MIKVVRGPVDQISKEVGVLYIDEASKNYALTYEHSYGGFATYYLIKEVADFIAKTLEEDSMKQYQRQPIALREKPVTDIGKMVDRGYSAQDLINLKREGII